MAFCNDCNEVITRSNTSSLVDRIMATTLGIGCRSTVKWIANQSLSLDIFGWQEQRLESLRFCLGR